MELSKQLLHLESSKGKIKMKIVSLIMNILLKDHYLMLL